MAKAIKIARESSGFTYNTVPGSTGDLTRDGAAIDDTIFGQDFASSQPGLIDWGISLNGFYKGFAGYNATIKKGGSTTAAAGVGMTHIGENVFEIDLLSGDDVSVWDRLVTAVINDGGVPIDPATGITWIDYLHGRVKLVSTPAGAVTADFNYLPLVTIGKANNFSLTQTGDTTDQSDFDTSQVNNGFRIFAGTLLTVSLELSGFYQVSNAFFTTLKNRDELVIEINPPGDSTSRCRGFFKMISDSQTGDVGGDETETVTFDLSVPTGLDDGVAPFSWIHENNSTLDQTIQDILDAWEGKTTLSAQYLPDGSTGFQGDVVVTEASLSGGVDVINEFSFTLQGTGELIAV